MNSQPTPAQAAALAKQYPGRIWLMFNEPDNDYSPDGISGQCGLPISINHFPNYFATNDWSGLGTYLAQQYIRYYDAIKDPNTGDPNARLFPLGLLTLPMPTLVGVNSNWARAIPVWNAFTDELSRQNRSIDGIAIHAYPNNFSSYHSSGCNTGSVGFVDSSCVTSALKDAHDFFQGTDSNLSKNSHPEMTRSKEIWITEIGSLTKVTEQSWSTTRDQFENNIVA